MNVKILKSPIKEKTEKNDVLKYVQFPQSGWKDFYSNELSEADRYYNNWHIIMEEQDKAIGHCHICQSIKYPELTMFGALKVDNDFRGRGIAKTLFNNAMELLESKKAEFVILSTDFSNPARQHMYLQNGFEDIFTGPENAVVMVKSFTSKSDNYVRDNSVQDTKEMKLTVPEYEDYLAIDFIMNFELGKIKEKHVLPLNAWGKHGGYCFFRDQKL